MKKAIVVVILLLAILAGCTNFSNNKPAESEPTPTGKNMQNISSSGVWISFSEINAMLNNPEGIKAQFKNVIENCKQLKIDNLYIHVRSYCDSLFKSDYFPLLDEAKPYDFDVFEYMVSEAHNAGIKVHAWINPYRVTTSSTDVSKLSSESPAYKWLNDNNTDNDVNVLLYNGIYLNPAEYEVRELVINGIREILKKYSVDGIHLDDYFYPTTDAAFDSASYDKYKSTAKTPLSLDDWRRANVNALIGGCYTAVKFVSKDILFTVSPMASIEKNYNELYADVKAWVESGCLDYIIPQLYFGFDYPTEDYKFDKLLDEWKQLMKANNEVGLLIGLGTYKIGLNNQSDGAEWQTSDDIIARQAEICRNDKRVAGYVIFSYSSLFGADELNVKQLENLSDFINKTSGEQ